MYTGNVTPGGPSDVRDLPRLVIRKCSVGDFDNNAYLLTCRTTKEQLLIDAAADVERLRRLVDEGTGRLAAIVTTHRHADHVRALAQLAGSTGAVTMAGTDDADALPVAPDRRLEHGDRVRFGDIDLDVVHLRGHTPGSVALAYADPQGHTHLFTGDSLFPGGPGRTTDSQHFTSLMDDLQCRVFDRFPDDAWFYPGHGDDSTLGAERGSIPEWLARGW